MLPVGAVADKNTSDATGIRIRTTSSRKITAAAPAAVEAASPGSSLGIHNSQWKSPEDIIPGASFFSPSCESVVILGAKMCDQILTHQVTQIVLHLHELNEQVMLGIKTVGGLGALEVETQPFLDATHISA